MFTNLTPLRLLCQVAERALFLWNNDYIVSLVGQNRQVILPLIFGALERNARNHWNAAVHGLTVNVRKLFMEMDQPLYDECQRAFAEQEGRAKAQEDARIETWRRLEEAASSHSANGPVLGGSQTEGSRGAMGPNKLGQVG